MEDFNGSGDFLLKCFHHCHNRYIFAPPLEVSKPFAERKYFISMTKAEIVTEIAGKTGLEKSEIQAIVEAFMNEVKDSLSKGDNVYLRGFGSFIVKTRAEKTGRNISKNTTIVIPAHNIPAFKPAKTFVDKVKKSVKVK